MNALYTHTEGYLLQQVPLANDDVLLTFLTEEYGKIKVFGSKLQRSKKKKAELDYFRSLVLDLSHPKQNFKLRGVTAKTDFSAHFKSYEWSEFAFDMLKACAHFCPEEKPVPEIMNLLSSVWLMTDLPIRLVQTFFYTKLLWYNGVLPRFDGIREACFVDPLTLSFLEAAGPSTISLSNHERQVLEFMRRNEASELVKVYAQFEPQALDNLLRFLQQVVKTH